MARSAGGRVRPPSARRGLRRDGGHEANLGSQSKTANPIQSKTVYFRALIAAGHACGYLVLPNDSGACRPSWTCCGLVLDLLDCLGLVGLSSGINLSKYLSLWMFCDAIFLPAFRFRGDDMDRFLPKRHTLTHGALKAQLPCQSKRK